MSLKEFEVYMYAVRLIFLFAVVIFLVMHSDPLSF